MQDIVTVSSSSSFPPSLRHILFCSCSSYRNNPETVRTGGGKGIHTIDRPTDRPTNRRNAYFLSFNCRHCHCQCHRHQVEFFLWISCIEFRTRNGSKIIIITINSNGESINWEFVPKIVFFFQSSFIIFFFFFFPSGWLLGFSPGE